MVYNLRYSLDFHLLPVDTCHMFAGPHRHNAGNIVKHIFEHYTPLSQMVCYAAHCYPTIHQEPVVEAVVEAVAAYLTNIYPIGSGSIRLAAYLSQYHLPSESGCLLSMVNMYDIMFARKWSSKNNRMGYHYIHSE